MTVGRIRADHENESAFMTESKFCVPADSPMVFFSIPGRSDTRARRCHVVVAKAARISFWTK